MGKSSLMSYCKFQEPELYLKMNSIYGSLRYGYCHNLSLLHQEKPELSKVFIVCKPQNKHLYIWELPNGHKFKKPYG